MRARVLVLFATALTLGLVLAGCPDFASLRGGDAPALPAPDRATEDGGSADGATTDSAGGLDAAAPAPFIWGTAGVTFTNGETRSSLAPIAVPAACGSAPFAVIAESRRATVPCGTGAGPAPCVHAQNAAARSLHAVAVGASVALVSEDAVFVGASSPVFAIDWVIACGAPTPGGFGGTTTVTFTSGQARSTTAAIAWPPGFSSACAAPRAVAQPRTATIACGTATGPQSCPNAPGATERVVRAFAATTATGLTVVAAAEDIVWVGAPPPATVSVEVDYAVACDGPGAGRAGVEFSDGQSVSTAARVALPPGCGAPLVVTRPTRDSVKCGTPSGPTTCANAPGTTSRAVDTYATSAGPDALDLVVQAEDTVLVGATDGAYGIDYLLHCP
jgi:hypothetical protein